MQRFNCTACHAPQSTGELAVENTFKPTYTRKDGKEKINLGSSSYWWFRHFKEK